MSCHISVGLNVHARSISAATFIPGTGEVVSSRFAYDPSSIAE